MTNDAFIAVIFKTGSLSAIRC